ncbi:MAG: hypothetical protein BRC54_07655 [Cyanobacteria bacterium SW_7_48_12]|nr:MAG: hypothetical protein BRC54_07655 [Cyanobacteria bacterium SW_7_48_12]
MIYRRHDANDISREAMLGICKGLCDGQLTVANYFATRVFLRAHRLRPIPARSRKRLLLVIKVLLLMRICFGNLGLNRAGDCKEQQRI